MKIFKFKRKVLTEEQMEFNKRQSQEKLAFYLPDDKFIPIAELFKKRYNQDELVVRLADFYEVSELMVATKLFNCGLISTI